MQTSKGAGKIASEMIDRYIHFYYHECIQRKQEWRRQRCTTPAKTEYSSLGLFVLPAQSGPVHQLRRNFIVYE